jgi:hypothetical protein
MKKITLSYFLCIIPLLLSAQIIPWKSEGLTWNDFKGKPNNYVSDSVSFKYGLSINPFKEKMKDINVTRYVASANMDTNSSWVKTENKTTDMLLYLQTKFDIVEYNKRMLQIKINKSSFWFDIEHSYREQFKEIEQMSDEFDEKSENGSDMRVVREWSNSLKKDIKRLEPSTKFDIQPGHFGVGIKIAGGYGVIDESIQKYFTNNGNILFGLEASYDKAILFSDATLGFGIKNKKPYLAPDGKIWNNSKKYNFTILELGLGYAVYNSSKNTLIPYIGYSFSELLSVESDSKKMPEFRVNGSGICYGLIFDYSLYKFVNFTAQNPYLINYIEQNEYKIRTKLSVTPINFYQDLKGSSINLSVGFNFYGRRVRAKQFY